MIAEEDRADDQMGQATTPSPAVEVGDERAVDPAALAAFVEDARLHRLIVVTPATDGQVPYLDGVFAAVGRPVPNALATWDDRIDTWCDEYRARFADSRILEVNLTTAVFLFDRTHERVLVAYGVATVPTRPRDRSRMRQFPDVNVGVGITMKERAFPADRGHFLSHAAGGDLDINLFPQRRELNRGWSPEGRRFRQMERHTAARPGTFHYHRAEYDDLSWIPATLEYGILRDDHDWWIDRFGNKQSDASQ